MTQQIEHTPPEGMSLSDNWADVAYALGWFYESMHRKFQSVSYKGHWRYVDFTYLIDRIEKELEELHGAIECGESEDAIINECVDVANCALMIADWWRLRRPHHTH